MKILYLFLTFIFTVSCGPAVSQKKIKEVEIRKRECYLVHGTCKTSCNSWEYKYNHCETEPCCVVRKYIKPIIQRTTTAYTKVNYNNNTLYNATL
ncbi:beta-defensin 113 [Erinaceus europaeus]|uniref:Beta-defensin n=1 Tax=Erinaceus europaeus TaxID=9365 RepID=A0A1S3WVV2_ERIEU|nr:beta-defensin 113 [Erinaceus europaeus]